ncbi:MAG: nucleotidyltransferase family protein [Treponema sp.]|uniref:nucleotidyltransferase family protein n=1 Tax=Treponema sp. TaxID=166 RepID=UPI003FA1E307
MKPTLLVLAGGMGSRYGGVKQIDSVGIHNETLLDYAVYDAVNNGFGKVVFVIRKDIEADFRERLFDRVARNCNAEYVFQSIDSLITQDQLKQAVNRKKPWGTIHAVLCAKNNIKEPFAIINADDYYGRSAYKTMAAHLAALDTYSPNHAMVGYILENTMSESGSVSRGICNIENGMLVSMKEHTKISYGTENGQRVILSQLDTGTEHLTGKETVSMNLFGFSLKAFEGFESFFEDFIKKQAASEKAECLLPEGASMLVTKGLGTIKCYTTDERWFGMTYPEDRLIVKKEIAQKIQENYYPEYLWK